ncbi:MULTISPECIES: esterase family protein [Ruoffia]|uniref:Esterase family protein n=1 Tax=Ruoffia tabacinasalis TaxID=87458 RepID=A0ABS0LJC7_9LACT|nr:alpha/beta hydrolase-fold protein [Ruoffia tabacinasalis]MBG9978162.1 esterase family protein [Ruoffia tabacinasalis]
MHFEARSHYSGHLGREMYFNRYGHGGTPVIVFPSSGGSKDEYADFKMVETLSGFIESGQIHLYTVSSIDSESWNDTGKSAHDKAKAHNQYDKYLVHEFIPLVRHESQWDGKMIATGCSMGGFHSMLFALRHPDIIGLTISQSGVYDARYFTGEFGSDIATYENSPIDFLWNMSDPWFLDQYRQNQFIVSVGQGDWEGPHVTATRKLDEVFNAKGIPGWFDYWGHDVAHDWHDWRQQIYYFFSTLEDLGIV